jgi:hypothetical protein
MLASSDHDSDVPDWLRALGHWAWANRHKLAPPTIAGLLTAVVCLVLHLICVAADLKLARADLNDAWGVVRALDDAAFVYSDQAASHRAQRKEALDDLDKHKVKAADAWVEWKQSVADTHRDLERIKFERAERLLRRTAEFRALLVAAERELASAQDAHLHGQSARAAPRVREILAPVLALR